MSLVDELVVRGACAALVDAEQALFGHIYDGHMNKPQQ